MTTQHPDNHPTPPSTLVKYKLGWTFTQEEERRMQLACQRADLFMQKYGKGRKPYMIDKTRYYKGITDENNK